MRVRNKYTKEEFDLSDKKWDLIVHRKLAHKYEILEAPPQPKIREVKPRKNSKVEIENLLETLKPHNEESQ